jgi:hypothetical protein
MKIFMALIASGARYFARAHMYGLALVQVKASGILPWFSPARDCGLRVRAI